MLIETMALEYRTLTDGELVRGLTELKGWTVEEGKMVKQFGFKTYKDGLVFAVSVGYLADMLDHHPDMEVGFQSVKVSLSTHSVGGLSPFDMELAKRIDGLG